MYQHIPHVLLLYREMIPSLVLCGHAQMEALAKQGRIEYRTCSEKKISDEDFAWAEVVLLGRPDNWLEACIVERMHAAEKKLVYILDDDLFHVPASSSCAAHYRAKETQKYLRRILALSDAILSPSPTLLERYASVGQTKLLVEEPALSVAPFHAHKADQPVKIGFAGSLDRVSDVEAILRDTLIRIKREFGARVSIEFFGVKPSFAKDVDARVIPYCSSYEQYLHQLGLTGWDIGLAPMPRTDFHACKHYIKLIEYASAGIVGIFSDVAPYSRMKDRFAAACFCRNTPESWYESIRALIENRPELERMRRQANALVKENMNAAVIADALYTQMLPLFSAASSVRPAKQHFALLRLRYIPKRIQALFSTYGASTVWVVAQKLCKKARKALCTPARSTSL